MAKGNGRRQASPEQVATREANLRKAQEATARRIFETNSPKRGSTPKPRTVVASTKRKPRKPASPPKAKTPARAEPAEEPARSSGGGFLHGLREGLGI